jgi:hypothetical protein
MTILAGDHFANFGRVTTNGWNQASDGQTWQILQGTNTHYSVVGNKGQITGATSNHVIALGTGTSVDQDVRVRVSSTAVADSVAVAGRMTAFNTAYRARLQNNQFAVIAIVAGTITTIKQQTFTTTAGTAYQIHLRLRGSTVSASVWADGTIEPATFMVSGTDTQITAAGQYGIVVGLAATTDIASFDQFVATNPTQVVDSPYGVTIGLNNKTPPTPNYANWAALFGDMRALGISWLRFQVDWQLIQLNQTDPPSVWSWAPLDDAVNRCNEAGIYITHPLRGAPSWALTQQASTEPWYIMDPSAATTFATQVVTRYNGSSGHGTLNAYEVGNEEFNIHFSPSGQGILGIHNSPFPEYNGLQGVSSSVQPARDPYFFTNVMSQVSPAVRSAAPAMKIGQCAIWWRQYPNCADFMTAIYQGVPNAVSAFDFANFHFYSNTADPSTPGSGANYSPSFQQEWQAMKAAMVAQGDTNKFIWVTEFGWGTNANNGSSIDCDTSTQSLRYSYVLGNALISGAISKVFFFTLNYSTQNAQSQPTTSTSSIVQWDVPSQTFQQLPAYQTIRQFIQQFPVWATNPSAAILPAIARRDGKTSATRRDGVTPLTKRRG